MGLHLCKKGPLFWRTGKLEVSPQSSGHMLYISVDRVVWRAPSCGSILEPRDNGVGEGSGELFNLVGRYLLRGRGRCWLAEGNVACRGKYLYHVLTYCEGRAGGSRVQWLFCLDGWSWVQFVGERSAWQEGACWQRSVWDAYSGQADACAGFPFGVRAQAGGRGAHELSGLFTAIQVGS